MRARKILAIVVGVFILAGPLAAQTIGIGTTKGGATAQIAAAIAKVVSANSPVQVRPQAMANTQQYIPFVNDGQIELGLANVPQTRYAVTGTGMSQGKPNPNLRMLARLITFRTGLMVAADSGIEALADLSGKKLPAFPARALGEYIIAANLSAADLHMDAVQGVPTSNFPTMWKMFKAGQIDAAIVAVGSKPAYDFEASLGGVRFIDFGSTNLAISQEFLPGSFLVELKADGTPGEAAGVHATSFDYALFAGSAVPDDVVAKVVAALHDNAQALRATSPLWKSFEPAQMAKDVGVEFHPGARAYYQQQGIWTR